MSPCQAHPGVSLDPHLAATSANFQAYVRRGLDRVAERRQSQADRPGVRSAASLVIYPGCDRVEACRGWFG